MHWTALQPLRLGAEKRGRQKQLLQQQQLLFLWKKTEDENTDKHLCKKTNFRSFERIHYLLIGPNTEKCKGKQAVKGLLHFTLFRIQARSTVAKSKACTLAPWYISNDLKQLQCIWRKFGTHLGFYNKQLGEVYVKKFNGAKTETFLHCANFWNAAHYASVDHNILWAGCTAGWNAAVEIDKGGKHCRAVNLYCTSALLHWQSCASLVLSSFANGSDDWQSSGSPLFWRLLSRIEKVCGRLSGSGSVIHSTVGKTDSSSLHCT